MRIWHLIVFVLLVWRFLPRFRIHAAVLALIIFAFGLGPGDPPPRSSVPVVRMNYGE